MAATTGAIAVGISLGSESATLAIAPACVRDANGAITTDVSLLARPTVIAAEDGERSTPAFGAWVNSELLVGAPGKNAALRHPKRSIGCLAPLFSKVKEFQTLVKAKIDYSTTETTLPEIEEVADEEGNIKFVSHTVSEVLIALFTQMNKLASGAAGVNPISAIIVSIPRYVSSTAVLALLKKVEFTGTPIIEVIYDDVAACLANGIGAPTWTPKTHHNAVLVVDCGATATSASVLTITGGAMTLVSTEFTTEVSGQKVDDAIAAALIETFKRKSRGSIDEQEIKVGRPYRKLLIAAAKAKKTLTSSQTANCEVEAFFNGQDLTDSLTRGKLEGCLTADLNMFKPIEELMTRVLKAAADKDETLAISHVVLHGGIMRIPAVQKTLKEKAMEAIEATIENDDQLDMLDDGLVEVLDAIPGDEAACLGATIQAALIAQPCDSECNKVETCQMKREALTFDIGFWAGSEAPKLTKDGLIDLPDTADDDKDDNGDDDEEKAPREMEPMWKLLIQRGCPVPMELNIVVPTETSMLLLARTAFKKYVPLASSVEIPENDSGMQTLYVLVTKAGELTVTPVATNETYAEVEPLVKTQLF